jgi:hypothetical protein
MPLPDLHRLVVYLRQPLTDNGVNEVLIEAKLSRQLASFAGPRIWLDHSILGL